MPGGRKRDRARRRSAGPAASARHAARARCPAARRAASRSAARLLSSPDILLLDEPLAALDAARRSEILPYLERLRDETKLPMLYVSHAVDEVARLADEIVVLRNGNSRRARLRLRSADTHRRSATGIHPMGAVLDARIESHRVADGSERAVIRWWHADRFADRAAPSGSTRARARPRGGHHARARGAARHQRQQRAARDCVGHPRVGDRPACGGAACLRYCAAGRTDHARIRGTACAWGPACRCSPSSKALSSILSN